MRAFIASLGLCLAGCQHDPYTWYYTTTQPKTADLVGTYVPDKATLELVSRGGYDPKLTASIVLDANGVLTITNVPDWWAGYWLQPPVGFDTGRGTWSVEPDQRWWSVGVLFPSTPDFAFNRYHGESFGTTIMLVGEQAPYKLHMTLGDPDMGQAMRFEKLPTRSK